MRSLTRSIRTTTVQRLQRCSSTALAPPKLSMITVAARENVRLSTTDRTRPVGEGRICYIAAARLAAHRSPLHPNPSRIRFPLQRNFIPNATYTSTLLIHIPAFLSFDNDFLGSYDGWLCKGICRVWVCPSLGKKIYVLAE
jgi:hypothetical protein